VNSIYWAHYLRGLAYLNQRFCSNGDVPIPVYSYHRGIAPLSALYPLAQLAMARAAGLLGDSAKARKAYQDFFARWKDADQDIPILVEAKKEYEQI